MSERFQAFLFSQPNAAWRLAALRINLAAVVSLTVVKLPPGDFFEEHRDTVGQLIDTKARSRLLGKEEYESLRRSTLLALATWAATGSQPMGLTAAVKFARLSEHVVAFFPKRWSYNSHLNVFLLVLGAVDTSGHFTIRSGDRSKPADDSMIQSLALAFTQAYTGFLYLQSAVSKIKYGGVEWGTSGRTLRMSTAIMGTGLGKRLYRHDWLFKAMSVATVGFEALMLPALIFGWPNRRVVALCGLGFHLGAASVLRISFWHLWSLYPALFLLPSPDEARELWKLIRHR